MRVLIKQPGCSIPGADVAVAEAHRRTEACGMVGNFNVGSQHRVDCLRPSLQEACGQVRAFGAAVLHVVVKRVLHT
jgi:hypothetical protein